MHIILSNVNKGLERHSTVKPLQLVCLNFHHNWMKLWKLQQNLQWFNPLDFKLLLSWPNKVSTHLTIHQNNSSLWELKKIVSLCPSQNSLSNTPPKESWFKIRNPFKAKRNIRTVCIITEILIVWPIVEISISPHTASVRAFSTPPSPSMHSGMLPKTV